MVGNWSKPPDWFKVKDYAYLRNLDADGWLCVLGKCARLRSDTLARRNSLPDLKEEWAWIGEPGWTDDIGLGFIGLPAVHVVDKADQASLSDLEKPALIVLVSLRATDHDIMEGFKKALLNARHEYPGPANKPGPKALNAKFDETIFDRWMRHKIVELCELEEWRSRLPREDRPKNADFGRWLFEGRDNQDKLISDALKMLATAVDEIQALTLQVERAAAEKASAKTDAKPRQVAAVQPPEKLTKNSTELS